MKVKRYPLSRTAKSLILVAFTINVIASVVAVYNYVPRLSIAPAIFWSVFFLLLLMLRFRYALLEKYPYLLSLPSFVYRLGMEKSPALQGAIISRVFTVFSLSLLFISLLNLAVAITAVQKSFWIFIPVIVFVFVVTVFALYRSIYSSFASKR